MPNVPTSGRVRATRWFGLIVVVLIAVVTACSSSDDTVADAEDTALDESPSSPTSTSTPTTAPPPTTVTTTDTPSTEPTPIDPVLFADDFGNSIQPILANSCADCHNAGGPGSPHWPLETAADAQAVAGDISLFVRVGAMPPWPASSESVAFHGDRRLRDDEVAAVIAWAEAGGEIDVAPSSPIQAPERTIALNEIDMVIEPAEPFDGTTAVVDDYRCLIYDPQVTESAWIEGFHFVPDQTEIVHHAIGYLLPAEAMDAAVARSTEDEAGGWQCYGSSGLPYDDPLFLGWAPGQDPTQYPEGSGVPIEPGEFIVVQIHYHNEVDTPADRSTLALDMADGSFDLDEVTIAQYIAPAEIPCSADESGPLCDRDAALADAVARFGDEGVQADLFNRICGVGPDDFAEMTDGIASSSCDLPIYEFGEIVAVLGHQHEIGSSFRMTLNPDRPNEKVLLDIPVWDFDWQFNYRPAESIVVSPGDSIRIECSWDRSLRDPDLEPRYILWADGTDDEMCFSTVATRSLD